MPHPIPEPATYGTTTTTKVPLYWVRYGDPSNPTLIVLHGGPGTDHRYLLPQMLHLAERYELLMYDQRGGGRSRAEDNAPVTWRDHTTDLAQLCREFGLMNPSLVGYSWGAMLSMLYSIESLDDHSLPSPARLCLISPAPVTKAYRDLFDEALRTRGNTPKLVGERNALNASGLRDRDPEGYRQRLFELGVAGYFADQGNARELTPFRVVGRVQKSVWDSLGDYDILPALKRVRIPACVIQGRDDPIPVQSSVDAAHALATEVTLIDNCGHVPYVECPSALWGALDPFLASTDALVGVMHD